MKNRLHVVAVGDEGRQKTAAGGGLADWLLALARQWREGTRAPRRKQLNVVETLTLGAKSKLVLVSCGGERFLVGTGPESVGTIMRVRGEAGGIAGMRETV